MPLFGGKLRQIQIFRALSQYRPRSILTLINMNRIHLSAGAAVLILCGLAVLITLRRGNTGTQERQPTADRGVSTRHSADSPERPAWRSSNAQPRRTKEAAVSESTEVEALRRKLDAASVELEKVSRPLFEDVMSSTVRAEIQAGESLVTGGYRTADGNYELTIITPRSVRMDDGREAIDVESQVLSVAPEFVAANGLESIATNARNTLQHAEAWKASDVTATLASARTSEGTSVLSSPRILTMPSNPFEVAIGHVDGRGYSLQGTIESNPDGGFSVESRVERQEEPDNPE